jgi:hypothetical protein
MPLPKNKCLGCGLGITWTEQRRQYGRIIRRGLSPETAGHLVPRCQKCVTVLLEELPAHRSIGSDDGEVRRW